MGTIGTVGGYYQLSNLLSSGSGSSSALTGSGTSSLQALEEALTSSASSSSGSSYLLDLSPQAQQLLNGNSSTSSASGSGTEFTLTAAQQKQITDILEKYKDAPLTQATFTKIQNALQAAGLSPETLGAQDQVKSFDPTNVLLQALDGNYTSVQTPATDTANEQTKESNYMQNIVSTWKAIESSASSASGSASGSTVSSASGASL